MDTAALSDLVVSGDRRALARAISVVEDQDPAELVAALHPRGGAARIVGITGAPGSGKSTLTDRLVTDGRTRGEKVAVLAIDPSSPFTGGAVLGDRVRMQDHVSDRGVYIRSMSTRGALGGIAAAAGAAIVVLDAAGFDLVFVETVGVGQSEVDVIELVETTVVVAAPGFGDGIQAAKAGVLEIGDVFCVNKADLPGADAVARDLLQMLELGSRGSWDPPVVQVSATTGMGVGDLRAAIDDHGSHIVSPAGEGAAAARVERTIRRAMLARTEAVVAGIDVPADLVDRVLSRQVDPWTAAAQLT